MSLALHRLFCSFGTSFIFTTNVTEYCLSFVSCYPVVSYLTLAKSPTNIELGSHDDACGPAFSPWPGDDSGHLKHCLVHIPPATTAWTPWSRDPLTPWGVSLNTDTVGFSIRQINLHLVDIFEIDGESTRDDKTGSHNGLEWVPCNKQSNHCVTWLMEVIGLEKYRVKYMLLIEPWYIPRWDIKS